MLKSAQMLFVNTDRPKPVVFLATTNLVFTARRYASAVLAVIVCLSVCPSVRHKSELYKDG